MLRTTLSHPHRALVEVGGLAALYALYELVRGAGHSSLQAARAHADAIVSLERDLNVFHERAVQQWAQGIPVLPTMLGFAYMSLHLGATALAVRWIYRNRPDAFPVVRTTLIASTAIALVGYVLYPAAPPRLAGVGFTDTVSAHTGLNLSSDLLGAFYNPYAAVPSLHFGYALLVGVALAVLAKRRWVRVLGALYPAFMLFDIVATGNHFLFDATVGGLVTVAGWWLARTLLEAAPARRQAVLRPVVA
jgi:hypothetical protein